MPRRTRRGSGKRPAGQSARARPAQPGSGSGPVVVSPVALPQRESIAAPLVFTEARSAAVIPSQLELFSAPQRRRGGALERCLVWTASVGAIVGLVFLGREWAQQALPVFAYLCVCAAGILGGASQIVSTRRADARPWICFGLSTCVLALTLCAIWQAELLRAMLTERWLGPDSLKSLMLQAPLAMLAAALGAVIALCVATGFEKARVDVQVAQSQRGRWLRGVALLILANVATVSLGWSAVRTASIEPGGSTWKRMAEAPQLALLHARSVQGGANAVVVAERATFRAAGLHQVDLAGPKLDLICIAWKDLMPTGRAGEALDARIAARWRRALRPGGRVVIAVSAAEQSAEVAVAVQSWLGSDVPVFLLDRENAGSDSSLVVWGADVPAWLGHVTSPADGKWSLRRMVSNRAAAAPVR